MKNNSKVVPIFMIISSIIVLILNFSMTLEKANFYYIAATIFLALGIYLLFSRKNENNKDSNV